MRECRHISNIFSLQLNTYFFVRSYAYLEYFSLLFVRYTFTLYLCTSKYTYIIQKHNVRTITKHLT